MNKACEQQRLQEEELHRRERELLGRELELVEREIQVGVGRGEGTGVWEVEFVDGVGSYVSVACVFCL